VAEEAGLSRDTVSKPESGAKKRPHGITVGKITRALGVDTMAWRTCQPPIYASPTSRAARAPSNATDKEEAKRKALQRRAMP
jgi:hypothetical protein